MQDEAGHGAKSSDAGRRGNRHRTGFDAEKEACHHTVPGDDRRGYRRRARGFRNFFGVDKSTYQPVERPMRLKTAFLGKFPVPGNRTESTDNV